MPPHFEASFFGVTPAWLVEKAERAFQALRDHPNPDTIFDFFVTATSAIDNSGESGRALAGTAEGKVARAIANTGKHAIGVESRAIPSHADTAPSTSGSVMVFTVRDGGREIDVLRLAARLMTELRKLASK